MTLKEVINANEIICNEEWFHEGYTGTRIFIKGYLGGLKQGDRGYNFGKKKLELLLKDKEFKLYAPEFWEKYGKEILVCSVYLQMSDIKVYFPEFVGQSTL